MKRTIVLTAVAALLLATVAEAAIKGTWSASSSKDVGKMYFNISQGHFRNNGSTMEETAFAGLTRAQIHSATQVPVTFEMRREAGTVSFEGVFKNGDGAGHFTFTPNRSYAETLRGMGLTMDDVKRRERDDDPDDQLFQLAYHDVSTSFIRTMRAAGYNESLDKYVAMRIFRVTPELINDFRALGYDKLSADDLVSAQIHKATPAYIREMRAAGFSKLDWDDFISSRIHKVTPQFAEEMKAAGYTNLKYDDLMSFRIHRVTPQFIKELRELGYTNVDADDLVAMRIHRVTPEFIRELKAAGYSKVPVDKLVSMRIHGIDAKFVKKMSEE